MTAATHCRHGVPLAADDTDGRSTECDRCQFRTKLDTIAMPTSWMPTRGPHPHVD